MAIIDPELAQGQDQGPGIRSGLRDMAASFRAMLEARKMQRHARDEREQRIANEAYRQRQQELAIAQQQLGVDRLEQQKLMDERLNEFKQAELEAQKTAREEKQKLQDDYKSYLDQIRELQDKIAQEQEEEEPSQAQIDAWERALKSLEHERDFAQKRLTGDFADDPDTSATEQYRKNIKFIDEQVQNGALTAAAAAEAKRLALRQLLKLPLNEKDRQNPVQTYLEHQAAIQEAIKSGAITQEEADRMQQSTKEQLFPIDTDDNKYIEDFEDVKNAYMQMGDTPEAAEEKAEKYLKDKLTEKGTGFERINQKVSQITDPKIRQYARQSVFKGIAGRTLPYVLEGFVDNFLEAQMGTLPEEAIYDAFGEMWLTYTKDKLAPQRRQAADMFQNMYRKLVELKEETGITTGRVTSGLFSQMTREELSRAATEWTFELIRPEGGLTPAQESKIAEVHAYITSEFKKFLLMLSGTAASDQEVAFVRSMYPNIFMSEEVNLGIIAGNIQVLHDNELAHFTEESDPEFAQKVMQARRWHTVIKPKTKKKRVHVQPGDDEWEEIKRKTAENAEKW